MSESLHISDKHPLLSELSSLRNAVTRFQDEAYSTSMKLQRHSLRATNAHDRAAYLEHENEALRSELSVLRAHPHPNTLPHAHPAALQVQQLTLSLRRLSEKLSHTEDALLERTTQLAYATGEVSKAKLITENAYELAARTRGREEAGKLRESDLQWKLKAAEEAAKMSDLVVAEYADLVRSLGSKSATRHPSDFQSLDGSVSQGSAKLKDSLAEGKLGLQRLFAEFSTAAEKSQRTILETQGELADLKAKHDAENKCIELCRLELARSQAELERMKIEDNTAAKMVSRYMKFSQRSTDTLQDALEALKARHTANIDTVSAQMSHLSSRLQFSESQTEKLRDALDELGNEILKEAYGRRREIALRIRMINREEKLREGLERWLRRLGETLLRDDFDSRALRDMAHEAHTLLSGNFDGLTDSSNGSLARLITAESAIEALTGELQMEMTRRLELERILNRSEPNTPADYPPSEPPTKESIVNPVVNDESTSIDALRAQDHITRLITPIENAVHLDQPSTPIPSDATTHTLGEELPLSQSDNLPPTHSDETTNLLEEESPELGPSISLDTSSNDKEEPHINPPTEPQVSPSTPETLQIPSTSHPSSIIDDLTTQMFVSPKYLPHSDVPSSSNVLLPVTAPATVDLVDKTEPSAIDTPLEEIMSYEDTLHNQELTQSLFDTPSDLIPTSTSTQTLMSLPHFLSPQSSPMPAEPVVEKPPPHPLLAELPKTILRYDSLQRSLRDCYFALETLSSDISVVNFESSAAGTVPPELLRTALQRLTDYTEDARVEVEIRIADEALMVRGFETLLSVSGALSSSQDNHDTLSRSDIERQVEDFVSGTEPSIDKAYRSLSRKLEDIQHDIAALKQASHAEVVSSPSPHTAPSLNDRGNGWSSWILNSPSSPASSASGLRSAPGLNPTFGNIMTTPRLRHSPSLNFEATMGRRVPSEAPRDPFTRLGLRVPMPSHMHHSVGTVQVPQPRSRTLSTMYMLGFGARKLSGSPMSTSGPSSTKSGQLLNTDADSETDVE